MFLTSGIKIVFFILICYFNTFTFFSSEYYIFLGNSPKYDISSLLIILEVQIFSKLFELEALKKFKGQTLCLHLFKIIQRITSYSTDALLLLNPLFFCIFANTVMPSLWLCIVES